MISSDSVSAVVLELNLNRIESRHVVEPPAAYPLDTPTVVLAISKDSSGLNVVDEKTLLNDANTE